MVGTGSDRGFGRVRAAAVAALVMCGLLGGAAPGLAQSQRAQAGAGDQGDLDSMLNVHEKKLLQDGLLPEARAGRCQAETVKIFEAWSSLLIPHFASGVRDDGDGTGTAGTAPQQQEPEEDPYGTLKR